MKKILIVEDNDIIIKGLKYLLKQEGYEPSFSKTVKNTIEIMKNQQFDLCVLDITLPDGTGYELCEYIKKYTSMPIIFLSARDEEQSIVKGIDMGAEDYIVKPFRNRELVSRIKNVFRRFDSGKSRMVSGNIEIDLNEQAVYVNNENVLLTSLEYKILSLLINNAGKVVKREQILDKIWDVAGNFVNDNTLTVYIKRIREKLQKDDFIKTVKGIGYKVVLEDKIEK